MEIENKVYKSFSIKKILSESWNIYKERPLASTGLYVLFFVILLLMFVPIAIFFPSLNNSIPFSMNLIFQVFITFLSFILLTCFFKISRREALNSIDWMSRLKKAPSYIIKSMLAGVLVLLSIVLGILMIIIPGIIVWIRLLFCNFYIYDKDVSIVKSLEYSWNSVTGATWKVFCFMLIIFLINFLGIICLVIGLFVTIPFSLIAMIRLYDTLHQQTFPMEAIEVHPEKIENEIII